MRQVVFYFIIAVAIVTASMFSCNLSFAGELNNNEEVVNDEIKTESTQAKKKVINEKSKIEPPDVIINDKKIIFKQQPIFDGELWLLPAEEIAAALQDIISLDPVNKIVTVSRVKDKSRITLDLNTGSITVNNTPFRTLFGYEKIIIISDALMIPTSAVNLLFGLTSKDDLEGRLVFKSSIHASGNAVGIVQPLSRNGIKDLLVDYLTVTNKYDWFTTEKLAQRRSDINAGFHNDRYALISNLVTQGGTDAPLINFDSASISYYENNSPLQVHAGDSSLGSLKSPFLQGVNLRGIQLQTKVGSKDSKFVTGAGLLPSNSRAVGRNLAILRYGRLAEVAEWSTAAEKPWQFSLGETFYSDTDVNSLLRSEQTGGLFAGSVTKTGKYVEGDANLALNSISDSEREGGSGFGGDVIVRIKPKDWFNIITKGAYYGPKFFSISGNPYYNNRSEFGGGFQLRFSKLNFSLNYSLGETNLDANKPNKYSVTNANLSSTPFMSGPTFIASYSKNLSQASVDRSVDNLVDPITETTEVVDFESLIERRTTSFFRAGLLKSWRTFNVSASVNRFTFENETPLSLPLLGGGSVTELLTYDLNVSKSLSQKLRLQGAFQGNEQFKQVKIGFNAGPLLNKRLAFQYLVGGIFTGSSGVQSLHNLNLNYRLTKRHNVNLTVNKTPTTTWVSTLWQYNMRPETAGGLLEPGQQQTIGRISGKVVILDETPKDNEVANSIVLPSTTRETGVPNIGVYIGSYKVSTDKNGVFEFPSLAPGVHKVRVEFSDLPAYLTSITPESVDINVEAGKETNFKFVLAYFGSLSGKLSLRGEPEYDIGHKPELQDIRIYLVDSEFETLTDINGSFILGDVDPGKYILKIDPDYLPDYLTIRDEGIEVEVRSKDEITGFNLPIEFKEREKEIKEF